MKIPPEKLGPPIATLVAPAGTPPDKTASVAMAVADHLSERFDTDIVVTRSDFELIGRTSLQGARAARSFALSESGKDNYARIFGHSGPQIGHD